ncbi:MAG: tetratricopeptide repeat protein [Acidobacteriia bacterium]|nr:tetratricopeptide repeat protein [Terriglobia bacterium]
MAKRKAGRPPAPPPGRRFPEWFPHALGLAVLAIAIYANSVPNGFVGDDQFQLLRNPLITDPGKIPQILGSSVWAFLGLPGNYYRPLQFLVYLLLYQCAGFHAAAFHLFMVLLHAGNTVLLFLLVRRLAAGRVALAAAALFAAHPIHTEVVDWIAALPDLMLTTLVLAGVLVLVRQGAAPRGWQIFGHCACYLLALLTKETGVMLLPLYAGFGFFYLGRRWSEFRRNAGLYAAMMAAFGVYLAMRGNALGGLAPGQQSFIHLGPEGFALSVVVTAAQYVAALLFPADLNYFHVFHPTHAVTVEFLFSAMALAALAALLLRSRTPLIAYGVFWMAAAIAPPLNLTGVGPNVFAERYLYLPSAGFCWIAGWAWDWLAGRRLLWARTVGAVVLLACALKAMARNRDWRDNFTMVQITVRQSPTAGWVHDALASEYVERDAFDQALEHERLAVRYDPDVALFQMKLGYLLMRNDPRAAIAAFEKVVALEPAAAKGHCDLGMAFEAAGDLQQAAREYERALQLQPQLREAQEGYRRASAGLR